LYESELPALAWECHRNLGYWVSVKLVGGVFHGCADFVDISRHGSDGTGATRSDLFLLYYSTITTCSIKGGPAEGGGSLSPSYSMNSSSSGPPPISIKHETVVDSDDESSLSSREARSSTRLGANYQFSSTKDQPLFLRKTYEMLETCPQDIASWSDKGDSLFIKDPEAFAQSVIPQYFAHSNFSSFVRQVGHR